MHRPTRSNPNRGCFSCGSPPYGWPVSKETKPSTVIFDSKAGRTLESSSGNEDREELNSWRKWDGGIPGKHRIVVSGYTTCTNANRDSRSEDHVADRIGDVFFVCAIMSEHGSVVNEVIPAENPDCSGNLGNPALLVIQPGDWTRVVFFLTDMPVICHVVKTDGNLF